MPTVGDAIDRLLVASCELAPDADIERIVDTFLAIAADVLPDVTIGARVPAGEGTPVIVRRSVRSLEGGSEDATRLFPSFEHERIVDIPGEGGATLHLAANDRARVYPDAPLEGFVGRFVMTIGAAIHRAHVQAKIMHTCRLASFGQLAAEIVHELNNPLTSIVAYSDYLHKKALRSGSDSADAERLARIVARQEYRLLHLTAAYDALLARALAAERALSSTK
jgi:two-component system NtrC family sensor kinase